MPPFHPVRRAAGRLIRPLQSVLQLSCGASGGAPPAVRATTRMPEEKGTDTRQPARGGADEREPDKGEAAKVEGVNGAAAHRAPAAKGKGENGHQGPEPRATDSRPKIDPVLLVLWEAFWADPKDEHRNVLVESYQRLVEDVVRRFAVRLPRTIDRGDLRTAANVGLMSAVCSFDPSRGVRFESYCEMRIRGALLDELRTQDWLPRPWRQKIELQKRTVEKLRAELGRSPQDQEVAKAMGLSLETYEHLFGIGLPGAPTGSMPVHENSEEGGGQGLEVVADTRSDAPGEKLTREEILSLVASRLSEQEYRIVYLKYWEELPMREIGSLMGLSESRVCKIHARLLERLQDRFRVHIPEE